VKRFLLSVVILFIYCNSYAQKIQFLKATEQHWVGGVCCSYGTNFIMYLQSNDTIHFIHIDTVWIGDKMYVENQPFNLNNYKNARKGITTYRITASTSWNKETSQGQEILDQKSPVKPPHYKGKGCLIYYSGKKRQIISVPEFVKLSPLAYP
jgi:hypothetical protein